MLYLIWVINVIIIVLLFLVFYLVWAEYAKDGYHSDYIGKEQTAAVNGLFTLLIVVSHFVTYAPMKNSFDASYIELKKFLGQLVVTTFLFYSGYGIHRSIREKGRDYIKWIPWRRFCKVLLHFDTAVMLFVLVGTTLLSKEFKTEKILYSLVGWESVGNSNWYIFAVLSAYIITYISFMIFGEKGYGGVITATVLSLVFVVLMAQEKDTWWYDTFFCYAAGMWYSVLKEKIDALVQKTAWGYWLSVAVCGMAFYITHANRSDMICYQLHGILFVLLIVLLSMKIKCTNKALIWLGQNAFWVYILQRLPMQVLRRYPEIKSQTYLYFVLCLAITILLAAGFAKLFSIIDKKLFSEKKKEISA